MMKYNLQHYLDTLEFNDFTTVNAMSRDTIGLLKQEQDYECIPLHDWLVKKIEDAHIDEEPNKLPAYCFFIDTPDGEFSMKLFLKKVDFNVQHAEI